MSKTFPLVIGFLLMSCASGYVPPVQTVRGPAMAPSVALDTSWTRQDPRTYRSSTGYTLAVYTNAAVGGTMFFESVPYEGKELIPFLESACGNARSRGTGCGDALFDYDNDGSAGAYMQSLDYPERTGFIVARPLLGEKQRILVCTGSWSLYGQPEDRQWQDDRWQAQLREQCRMRSGHLRTPSKS